MIAVYFKRDFLFLLARIFICTSDRITYTDRVWELNVTGREERINTDLIPASEFRRIIVEELDWQEKRNA